MADHVTGVHAPDSEKIKELEQALTSMSENIDFVKLTFMAKGDGMK